MGLAGDDDFHFKVSPDGSAWNEAILIDKDTGEVSFPSGVDIDGTGLPAGGTTGQVLTKASNDDSDVEWATPADGGTVNSVALSVPTGLQVSGSPITDSGTLAVSYASGYQGYTGPRHRSLPASRLAPTSPMPPTSPPPAR